jgi:hypothetical protein
MLASTLHETGTLYLLNATVLHGLNLQLTAAVDRANRPAGLILERLDRPTLYSEREHEDGLQRLAQYGHLNPAWKTIQAASGRLLEFIVMTREVVPPAAEAQLGPRGL